MWSKYPLEGLLRPPVEIFSIIALLVGGLAALFFHQFFLLSTLASYGLTIVLFLLLFLRLFRVTHLLYYQRRLAKQDAWQLNSTNIPLKKDKLFLGKGFRWSQKHTQRLKETESSRGQQLLKNARLLSSPFSRTKLPDTSQQVSGKSEIHNVELNESHVYMNLADRVGHTLVLGTTRVGKTRLAELLIAQDIRRGEVVVVFDPKGDSDLLHRVVAEAADADRLTDVRIFHLGYPHLSSRYNPIGRFTRITEVATRIANQLPSEGDSAAFREFAWRFVNVIARALAQLKITPTYRLIRRYINDIEPLFVDYARVFLARNAPKGWSKEISQAESSGSKSNVPATVKNREPTTIAHFQYIQKMDVSDPVMEGLLSALKYDRTYFDKIVSSVGPLMEKLTTGAIADLLSPVSDTEQDSRPCFEWMDLIKSNGILYIGLDSLTDTDVASAIGNSMFADLVSVAGEIYRHGLGGSTQNPHSQQTKINLHADEFNELIGDEFVPLLNKAGGAGFQVTAYTQTWSDVEARIGNKAKSGQVAGNFNTMIMLRVRELATAEMLTKQLPNVSVGSLTGSSGVSDSSKADSDVDFSSKNDDKVTKSMVPLVAPHDLFALPRGHAFALLDGGHLWKIRLPLLRQVKSELPSDPEQLLEHLNPTVVPQDQPDLNAG